MAYIDYDIITSKDLEEKWQQYSRTEANAEEKTEAGRYLNQVYTYYEEHDYLTMRLGEMLATTSTDKELNKALLAEGLNKAWLVYSSDGWDSQLKKIAYDHFFKNETNLAFLADKLKNSDNKTFRLEETWKILNYLLLTNVAQEYKLLTELLTNAITEFLKNVRSNPENEQSNSLNLEEKAAFCDIAWAIYGKGELQGSPLYQIAEKFLIPNYQAQEDTKAPFELRKALFDFSQQKSTLAENVDKAWGIYKSDNWTDENRQIAQQYLIYAFNIQKIDDAKTLNDQISNLVTEKNKFKTKNPEYIPGLSPKFLNLEPHQLNIPRTPKTYFSRDPHIKALFSKQKMLDVIQVEKQKDEKNQAKYGGIFITSPQERAQYRVVINNGSLKQNGENFSTENMKSHDIKGWASFVLNANGELSIFQHEGAVNKHVHSSFNNGSPVVAAGAIKVRNGIIEGISAYSGHMVPTFINTYYFLTHLKEHGVTIDNIDIYPENYKISKNKKTSSLPDDLKGVLLKNSPDKFKASELETVLKGEAFLKPIAEMLEKARASIIEDQSSYTNRHVKTQLYKWKDKLLSIINGKTYDLTEQRAGIAKKLNNLVEKFGKTKYDAFILDGEVNETDFDLETIDKWIKEVDNLLQENRALSKEHGKDANSGELHDNLSLFKEALESIQKQFNTRINSLY